MPGWISRVDRINAETVRKGRRVFVPTVLTRRVGSFGPGSSRSSPVTTSSANSAGAIARTCILANPSVTKKSNKAAMIECFTVVCPNNSKTLSQQSSLRFMQGLRLGSTGGYSTTEGAHELINQGPAGGRLERMTPAGFWRLVRAAPCPRESLLFVRLQVNAPSTQKIRQTKLK